MRVELRVRGASVAASLATVAVGPRPTARSSARRRANGIVGIKPTLGLVSRSGIVPISSFQDTAGPMARNVTDAAVLLGVLAGGDPDDAATAATLTRTCPTTWRPSTPAPSKAPASASGAKAYSGSTRASTRSSRRPPRDSRSSGATIVDPANSRLEGLGENEFPALLSEFKAEIAEYLGTLGPDTPKTLQDLIDFNLANADTEMALYKQETFDAAQAAPDVTDPSYLEARENATSIARQGPRRHHSPSTISMRSSPRAATSPG